MKKLLSICAAAVVACFLSSAASATTYTATWTGTVNAGTDSLNFFQAGLNLSNQAFKMVFTFDDTDMTHSGFPGTADSLSGPGATAALTINNQTYTIVSGAGTAGQDTVSLFSSGNVFQQVSRGGNQMLASDGNILPSFPITLDQTFSRTCNLACVVTAQITDPGHLVLTGTNFHATNFTLAATPIPAALPLFVSALGGLGFVGWRRQRANAA